MPNLTSEFTSIIVAFAPLFFNGVVVLEDVWKLAGVEPFRLGPGRSRLLYTSCDKACSMTRRRADETSQDRDNRGYPPCCRCRVGSPTSRS